MSHLEKRQGLAEEIPYLWGPILFGNIFSSLLIGIFLAHTAWYYWLFRRDFLYHKIIMGFMTATCILSFAEHCAVGWRVFIQIFADPFLVFKPVPPFLNTVVVAPWLASMFTQIFFGFRAYVFLGRRRLVALFLITICLAHNGLALAVVGFTVMPATAPRGDGTTPPKTRYLGADGLTVAASVDLIITLMLAYSFQRSRRSAASTRRKELHMSLTRFLRLTITTGAMTSSMAAITAILAHVGARQQRLENVWFAFLFPYPAFAGISIVLTLLQRGRPQWVPSVSSYGDRTPGTSGESSSRSRKAREREGGQEVLSETGVGGVSIPVAPSAKYERRTSGNHTNDEPWGSTVYPSYPPTVEHRSSSSMAETKRRPIPSPHEQLGRQWSDA